MYLKHGKRRPPTEAASASLGLAYANMRSAWICTRNDVLGNLAVLLAALGVFGTGTGWPDTIVAAIMALLAIQGAALVIRQASAELRFGSPLPNRRLRNSPQSDAAKACLRPAPSRFCEGSTRAALSASLQLRPRKIVLR
jgi:Co/Zn/Cd efflux system component